MSTLPDLDALRRNDSAAWDQLYPWLSSEARKSAQMRLIGFPEADVEDVAGAAVAALAEKLQQVATTEELIPLVKQIAANKAIDHLRKRGAAKHGKGKVASLDQLREEHGDAVEPCGPDQPDEQAQKTERGKFLLRGLDKIKPLYKSLLVDFYLIGKTYDELARDYRLALGSVGVYLNRALEALRAVVMGDSSLAEALKILVAALVHCVRTIACLP